MASSSPLSLFNDRPSVRTADANEAGAVLLLLVSLLFAALWTLFDLVSVAMLLMALSAGVALRAWHDRHPATEYVPDRPVTPPQINISAIAVGGDIGGALFVGAAVLTFIMGLPAMRVFAMAAIVGGVVAAVALMYRRLALPSDVSRRLS